MFLRHNFLGISWAIFILILCGLPGEQFQKSYITNADKVIHTFLFAVLFFLLSVGFIKQRTFPYLRIKTLSKVLIISMLYGLVTEVLQGAVFIGRSIDLFDAIFNGFGCLVGYGLFLAIYGRESYV
ncbi:MAG: VanZ family protein [Salibacteraceae bacterium]|jgi:VanZ family protein|nr:VanZ family protein [Salibacteraceae bacterium]MDP4687740.1 VanZ family protein [Salibacteraceae bacterium]MDP4933714.1 VanZ family protein [Salibacteraceae bacterium]MDP4965496.1 VanZ family protein [Salibacteraceae bacterium]